MLGFIWYLLKNLWEWFTYVSRECIIIISLIIAAILYVYSFYCFIALCLVDNSVSLMAWYDWTLLSCGFLFTVLWVGIWLSQLHDNYLDTKF